MRKTIAVAMLSGSLLVGGAVGSALLGGGVATAQSSSSDSQSSQSSSAPDSTAPAPPDGRGPRGGPHGGRLDPAVAANAIGISAADLKTALESGQSLADIATAHGVDPQKVIDALVADAKTHLAEQVSSGEITQAQADQISADLVQRITDHVNHAGGPGGAGCPGMDGDGPPAAPGTDSGSSSSSSASS